MAINNNTGVKHDITEITPYVGMTGLYSLKQPYTTLIDSTIEYTCISVINISGFIAQGGDPLKDIYLANGDTEDNYNTDAAANRCIVILQSGKGNLVTVPNSALNKLPNADGINYSSIMLGVTLSIIPDYLDLTPIKDQIKDLIFKNLGVRSNVVSTIMGGSITIAHAKHDLIENARLVNVSNSKNPLIDNEDLKIQNQALLEKVQLLENYIKTNHI
jgi:hypothetical protein